MALLLVMEIEDEMGVEADLADVFTAPTVLELAHLIDTAEARPSSRIIPLQHRGSVAPVFSLLGFDDYRELAGHLGEEVPFMAAYLSVERDLLQPSSPDQQIDISIDSVCEDYCDAIQDFQAKGPYRLIGYSFAGIIAIETALKLEARGEEVQLVFLLDTTLADSISRNWPVRIAHLLKEAWKDDPDNIRRRFKRKFRLSPTRTEQKISWQDADDLLGIFRGTAQRNYSGPTADLHARVVLIRASNDHWRARGLDAEPDYGWSKFFNTNLEVRHIQGNHLNIIEVPRVGELAEIIRPYLL